MGPQPIDRWAAGGGLSLSGRADGPPLAPPSGMLEELERITAAATRAVEALGGSVVIDPVELLTERARAAGLQREGTASCGGATRLLPASDDWIAVSLARPADRELVPAWLEREVAGDDWDAIGRAVASREARHLVDRARLLGLPSAVLGETPPPPMWCGLPVVATHHGDAPSGPLRDLVVVDLSSLWAGPLCGALLAQAGAAVVKVESRTRPDGARLGPPAFFERLNGAKHSTVLDLDRAEGAAQLRRRVEQADVVIEASRPRALEQLGIDAAAVVAEGPRAWVSITGHGRTGEAGSWVAFGDDAAVSGGLVCHEDGEPRFCADAVADPCAGLVAFAAVLEALQTGGRWLLDVSMAGVAAHLAAGGPA